MAEVSDKGENRGDVTVEGQFVGRLEGFRFQQDATGSADEAKTLRQAAMTALRPEFSLRADRFYNAPDTEMDFTEQGGLMWGSSAVGKLVKGTDPLKPGVEPFVDEEAGEDVIEKVRRRLQHFIDRKVAAQYEPLLALGKDETLQGLARGFAFRLSEELGVLPRDAVAQEVKELDQEARAALRKHGVRFGQYTVFQPALLKPAPTRLRLVLWSLWNGLAEFPESPPPGLVTIPNIAEVPKQHYTLSGYHPAGTRAIRIDMLERLADILRQKDSRGGFEATPDMLSITGMTLDQFADLMAGLGYKGEKGERPKAKPAEPVAPPAAAIDEAIEAAAAAGQPIPEGVSLLAPAPETPAEEPTAAAEGSEETAAAAVEMEAFYTFTWAPKPRFQRPERGPRAEGQPRRERKEGEPAQGDRPKGDRPRGERRDRPQGERKEFAGKGGKPGPKGPRRDGNKDGPRDRKFEARPPRAEKPIDPDNPFAALLALKGKV